MLLYVLRPYYLCSCHYHTTNVYNTKQGYLVHRFRVRQFIGENIDDTNMCDQRSGLHITNVADDRATQIPLVISVTG